MIIDMGGLPPSFNIDAARALLDNVMDANPGATDDQINDRLAQAICGQMRSKKTGEGVAATFWKYGALISRMRAESYEMHEMVVLEFAELLTERPWRR